MPRTRPVRSVDVVHGSNLIAAYSFRVAPIPRPASHSMNTAPSRAKNPFGYPSLRSADNAFDSLVRGLKWAGKVRTALYLIYANGSSLPEAGKAVGVPCATLWRKIRQLNRNGPAGLLDGRIRSGRRKAPKRVFDGAPAVGRLSGPEDGLGGHSSAQQLRSAGVRGGGAG